MLDKIVIRGAREHNLKDVDVEIPHDKLTVVSGVSGSGKSSLAFDTLYAEGQRRYIESLTTYAKQFLERIARPDVDDVSGISPSIAIQQKNTTRSSRSTVGTTTEIYDYLRLLFARVGRTFCPDCRKEVIRYEPDEVVTSLLDTHRGKQLLVVAEVPVKSTADALAERLVKDGYTRVLLKDGVHKLEEVPRRRIARRKELRVVIDRVVIDPDKRTRVAEAIESAYGLSDGFVVFVTDGGEEITFTKHAICSGCGREFEEPRPILFSFNTPYGACPECRGFGNRMEFDDALIVPDPSRSIREYAIEPWSSEKFEYFYDELLRFCRSRRIPTKTPFRELTQEQRNAVMEGGGHYVGVLPFLEDLREKTYKKYARFFTRRYLSFRQCRNCKGGRLRPEAYSVLLSGTTIREVAAMVPAEALAFVESLELTEREREIARDILLELRSRLQFMLDVGLYYVTLDRLTKTLSGGESQRINLANSLGANLIGVLYVLDEPSVGLHPRDTENLLKVLLELRDRGNTVVVVEHDLDIIHAADYLIDLGPGAGRNGGEVLYQGGLGQASHPKSKTIRYLHEGLPLHAAAGGKRRPDGAITITGVKRHNIRGIDVSFPRGAFTVVTGVSGSGKSTLVCDVLYEALRSRGARGDGWKSIRGVDGETRIMLVDQSPIGKTPRSNPITYIKAFSHVREIFAATKEARKRGYASGRFSFNVPGGRCVRCEGMGWERVEMHFMADMFVRCPDCEGRRFNKETLEITYRDRNLADVLDMTINEALSFFDNHKHLARRLGALQSVGLGYLQLGQPSTTLSGGESQRIKVARELAENSEGGAVYLLDEPTTGLHIDDVDVLVRVLRQLIERGNTVIVVEHNPQVILQADHVIDLGPGGGEDGGEIVAAGTPSQIMKARKSHTGAYLKKLQRSLRKGAA